MFSSRTGDGHVIGEVPAKGTSDSKSDTWITRDGRKEPIVDVLRTFLGEKIQRHASIPSQIYPREPLEDLF